MDESAQQAVQLAVNITIFVIALSLGITLMMGVRNVADIAFDYDASIPTGSRIVTASQQKKRIVSADELLSYYSNYMSDINNLEYNDFEIVIENLNGTRKITKDTNINNNETLKNFLIRNGVNFSKYYEVVTDKYMQDENILKLIIKETDQVYEVQIENETNEVIPGETEEIIPEEPEVIIPEETVEIINGAPIPSGYTISRFDGEKEVSEGLVIYDTDPETLINYTQEEAQEMFNQFVWIPVPDISEFTIVNWTNRANFEAYYLEPYAEGYATEVQEYQEMYESVKNHGGFYIGRYEAGITSDVQRGSHSRTSYMTDGTTLDVVVQKNKHVYNYVPYGVSMNNISGTVGSYGNGAVYLSKNMKLNNSSQVVSTLCYGVQWDAALKFISQERDIYNCTSWGNFNVDDYEILRKTGASETWKAKNIYDLAGNVREITMLKTSNSVIARGGGYNNSGNQGAFQESNLLDITHGYRHIGFRVALYLK